MKKGFTFYAACWGIMLALFNVICFVVPKGDAGFGSSFWTGYALITLSYIGQLACAFSAFKTEISRQFFYRIPLIGISYTNLIVSIIFGSLCMAVPFLPNWIGIIICFAVLAFGAVSVIKAGAAVNAVEKIDEKIKVQTQFVRLATADAQNLVNRAENGEIKAECQKVYEALRYSDPMSHDALSGIEAEITVQMGALSAAVRENNAEKVSEIAKEIVLLVKDRNNKCKLLK